METTEGEKQNEKNSIGATIICGITLLMLCVTCFYIAVATVMFGIVLVGVVTFIFIDGLASSLTTSSIEFYVASFWKLFLWIVVFVPIMAVIFSQGCYLFTNLEERYERLRIWRIRKTYNQLVEYYKQGKYMAHLFGIGHPVLITAIAGIACYNQRGDIGQYCLNVGFIYIGWYIIFTVFLLALRSFYRIIKNAADRWNAKMGERSWCKYCGCLERMFCCDLCNVAADEALKKRMEGANSCVEEEEDEFYNQIICKSKYGWVTDAYVEWTFFMHFMDNVFEPGHDDSGNQKTCPWHRVVAWLWTIVVLAWVSMHITTIEVSSVGRTIDGETTNEGSMWYFSVPCLYLFFSPLLASCNCIEMFCAIVWHRKERKIPKMQFICTILSLILAAISILSMVTFSLCSLWIFKTRNNQLDFVPASYESKVITNSLPASMCSTNINDWSMMQLIGMSAVASLCDTLITKSTMEEYSNYTNPIDKSVYEAWNNTDGDWSILRDSVNQWYDLIEDNENIELISIKGGMFLFQKKGEDRNKYAYVAVDKAEDGKLPLGMMVENAAMGFIDMVCEGIPLMNWFYNPLRELLHSLFINFVNIFVHEPITIRQGWLLGNSLIAPVPEEEDPNMTLATRKDIVIVGHGASGLRAKYMTSVRNVHSVAFEAPGLDESVLSVKVANGRSENLAIYNFLSDTSTFAELDTTARLNYKFEDSDIAIPTVYETLCMMAAGCTMSNTYDQICNKVLGAETYASYFEKWNRTRVK